MLQQRLNIFQTQWAVLFLQEQHKVLWTVFADQTEDT